MIFRLVLAVCAGLAAGRAAGIQPALLPDTDRLQEWHELKAEAGPTFAGSAGWRAHMTFLEASLEARGAVGLSRRYVGYRRWFASDYSLVIDGESLPVASYWAYSGSTAEAGVMAPLHVYQRGDEKEDFKGRIVVFQVDDIPGSMLDMFEAGHVHANYDPPEPAEGIASSQWFQGNYVTRFGRFDQKLRDSGAAGALVVFDMPFARAEGLYTFPLLRNNVVGVPGLYLDRDTGQKVIAAAREGQPATLRLIARRRESTPYFLHGFLPGRYYGTDRDEAILLVTHSDGPNLTQENGTLGILGIIDYFARTSQVERPRSILVLFDPQHYMPGRHTIDWYAEHPEIMDRVIASIGVEQLGQREYAMTDAGYQMNLKAEPTLIFVQDNQRLIDVAIDAVERFDPPRTEIRVPSRGGQGIWQGLGDVAVKRNLPGFAISSAMSGYWSTVPGIESFDAYLCYRQIAVLAAMTEFLMTADPQDIKVPEIDPGKNPALSPGVDR